MYLKIFNGFNYSINTQHLNVSLKFPLYAEDLFRLMLFQSVGGANADIHNVIG